jgi:diguanylate cyclase (GGDEF)-like protein/PAS domain S-box-containing protein
MPVMNNHPPRVDEPPRPQGELRVLLDRYHTLYDLAPVGYVACNSQQRIVDVNRTLAELLGYAPGDLIDRGFGDVVHAADSDRDLWRQHWLAASTQRPHPHCELRLLRADNEPLAVRLDSRAEFDDDGRLFECRTAVSDVSQRQRTEARLLESERLYRAVFERTLNPFLIVDGKGEVLGGNRAALRLLGASRRNLLTRNLRDCFRPTRPGGKQDLAAWLRHGDVIIEVETLDGPARAMLDLTAAAVKADAAPHYIVVGTDITDRKRTEMALRHIALHDPLTGLPNRQYFKQELEKALKRLRRRPDRRLAVLFLDIDRFKQTNDALGHLVGDQLLKEVGVRLAASLREIDTVARFGGDEFAVLIDDIREPADAATAAERIERAMAAPTVLAGRNVTTTLSVGIALSGPRRGPADDLIREADRAMLANKAAKAGSRPGQT